MGALHAVAATVSFWRSEALTGAASDTFTFPLNDATYAVPAGNTAWLPTVCCSARNECNGTISFCCWLVRSGSGENLSDDFSRALRIAVMPHLRIESVSRLSEVALAFLKDYCSSADFS